MKYVIALVLLISLSSSQLRDKTKATCDTNKWSEYTAADCSDATTEAFLPLMMLGIAM
jgi:hypothetical protein